MKMYEVEVIATVVVIGEDEHIALDNADEDRQEIKSDADLSMRIIKEVTADTLPAGWDADCIPYGGDGNVRIKNIK